RENVTPRRIGESPEQLIQSLARCRSIYNHLVVDSSTFEGPALDGGMYARRVTPGDLRVFAGGQRALPPSQRFLPARLSATAWRIRALNADSSTASPSRISIARRTLPSRLELKRRAGSFSDAPFANVSLTTLLYDSPVQMMPSCDHTGVPGVVGFTHFHSSTTSGSASLISARMRPRVLPRQSPSSAMRFEMSDGADG